MAAETKSVVPVGPLPNWIIMTYQSYKKKWIGPNDVDVVHEAQEVPKTVYTEAVIIIIILRLLLLDAVVLPCDVPNLTMDPEGPWTRDDPTTTTKKSSKLSTRSKSAPPAPAFKPTSNSKLRPPPKFLTQGLTSFCTTTRKNNEWNIGMKVLLDKTINGNKCPDDLVNKLFTYELMSVQSETTCTLEFKDQLIVDGGDRFVPFTDGETQVRTYTVLCFLISCD